MRHNDAIVLDHTYNSKWEKWYLLISDLHWDSPQSNRKLLQKLLMLAKERDAGVLIFGDLFDCMGGKYDPRTSKGEIREEHWGKNYFDLVVNDAVKWFEPYKDLIKVITAGNHEQSVQKHHEFSLLNRFVNGLKINVDIGEYAGFIRFKFQASKGGRRSLVMYYTHGTGGGAPVTMGVIGTNRRQVAVEADFYVSGHIHTTWNVPKARMKLLHSNRAVVADQEHIQLPSLKFHGNWETTKGFAPSPQGGYWLRFGREYENDKLKIIYDVVRAK